MVDGYSNRTQLRCAQLFDQLEDILVERAGLTHELKFKLFDEIRELDAGVECYSAST